VVSHETALAIYDISDANPAQIHMIVPPGYRKPMPPEVVLHHGRLSDKDWVSRDGYRITTPLKTILDIASSDVGWPHANAAVRDALDAGLVRKKQLLAADGPEQMKIRLNSAIAAAEHEPARLAAVRQPVVPDWCTQGVTVSPTVVLSTGTPIPMQIETSSSGIEVELKQG
jgi:hypothetical protein